VHLATLKSGEAVVVKVQRPGLKALFDIDLKNIRCVVWVRAARAGAGHVHARARPRSVRNVLLHPCLDTRTTTIITTTTAATTTTITATTTTAAATTAATTAHALGHHRALAVWLQKVDPKTDGAARDWVAIYDECSRILYQEIDYTLEGKNADRFRENFASMDWVKVRPAAASTAAPAAAGRCCCCCCCLVV
jgi:hypothetical protein